MRQSSSRQQNPPKSAPPRLEVFIRAKDGVSVEKALDAVEEANRKGPDRIRIATNREIGLVLQNGEWEAIRDAFRCWTGIAFGYIEPDKSFREGAEKIISLGNKHYIVYTGLQTKERWLFPVPDQYLDVRNGILVAEHPDFLIMRDGKDRIIVAKEADLVTDYPAHDGWYLIDPKHGIPRGKVNNLENQDSRRLWRLEKMVSLVARGRYDYGYYNDGRSVGGDYRPDDGFGVAVVREKRKLVFDDYRSSPRSVVVGESEDGNSRTETQGTKPETQNPQLGTQSGWFDRMKRAVGF